MTTTYHGVTIYANPRRSGHVVHSQQFMRLMDEFPDIVWFNVNPVKAPWHIRAVVNDQVVDAWPCALKAARMSERAVYGFHAIRGLILETLAEAPDDLELIDEGDFT